MPHNALRRRDPRLPAASIFEDVETIVGGEVVRSVPPLPPVDALIIETNDREMRRRRRVNGRDMDDWLLPADDALRAGDHEAAVRILRPVCAASLTLTQFDNREPDWFRFNLLARAYRGMADTVREEAIIRAWLAQWAPGRETTNRDRVRASKRLTVVRAKRKAGRTM